MCVEVCGFRSEVGLEEYNPSSTPTAPHTMLSIETCKDDQDYVFDLDNGNTQNCAWLTKNPAKTYVRIEEYCVRGRVKGAYGLSCNCCHPCKDNVSFTFDHFKRKNYCGWNTVNVFCVKKGTVTKTKRSSWLLTLEILCFSLWFLLCTS